MGKYEPLAHYLNGRKDNSWNARFSDVERVLGFELPRSAREYPAWWANQDGSHSQTKGWREAGWETEKVSLTEKRVRFVRKRPLAAPIPVAEGTRRPETRSTRDVESLVSDAIKLSGMTTRDEVITIALQQFVAREAGKQLAALGGTMPDLQATPRRRPSW